MVSIPSFGDVPFDVCFPLPNGNKLCVKSSDIIGTGTRDCKDLPSGHTPPIFSANLSYYEQPIVIFGRGGDITYSRSVYVGIESDVPIEDACVWVGEESLGVCASLACGVLPDPDPAVNTIDDIAGEIHGVAYDVESTLHDMDLAPDPQSQDGQILILAIVVVLAAIVAAGSGVGA